MSVRGTEEKYRGKFLKFKEVQWSNGRGFSGVWECVERTTTKAALDAVECIAFFHSPGHLHPELILVEQFRPAIARSCIEFPAGLVDGFESAETCGLRELEEETGYSGEIMSVNSAPARALRNLTQLSFAHASDLVSGKEIFVAIRVDGSLARNQNPRPHLEPSEDIITHRVPLDQLPARLQEWHAQGRVIDGKVHAVAMGLLLGAALEAPTTTAPAETPAPCQQQQQQPPQ
ncbi:putative NUDIX hydrolase domain protein [Paratrimastix pyriformis]|uniref:NUDIX hydrolase domain protein n=1 Tax=Paratrimastix pyriformis TaxID=342808 RepID=A0ABQ8UUS3_9EUKA|nr:putative NUDIX hydrolase domain protein [Paratrimastix pyriformis]